MTKASPYSLAVEITATVLFSAFLGVLWTGAWLLLGNDVGPWALGFSYSWAWASATFIQRRHA